MVIELRSLCEMLPWGFANDQRKICPCTHDLTDKGEMPQTVPYLRACLAHGGKQLDLARVADRPLGVSTVGLGKQ